MNTSQTGFTRASTILLCPRFFTLFSGRTARGAKPVDAKPITQVLLLPVALVNKLPTENKGVSLGELWKGIANRIKCTAFTESMESMRNSMAFVLTCY